MTLFESVMVSAQHVFYDKHFTDAVSTSRGVFDGASGAKKIPSRFGERILWRRFRLGNGSLLEVVDGRGFRLANLGEVGGAGAQSKAHCIGFADAQGEHDGGQSRLCFSFPTEGSAEGFVGFVGSLAGGDGGLCFHRG